MGLKAELTEDTEIETIQIEAQREKGYEKKMNKASIDSIN